MKRLNLLSLYFLILIMQPEVEAQLPQVSAVGHITAEVITVFSASETSQMNFGRFSPGPQGGEILLSPESTISTIGSVFSGTGTQNAASFYVSGATDASFTITLPTNPVVLRHVTTSKTMIIEDWMSNPGLGISAGILQDGFQVVKIGATLRVGTLNDNPPGIYAGTYTIVFDFN